MLPYWFLSIESSISSRTHLVTNPSHTLATRAVKEIGLSLAIVASISFGIRITVASLKI